eukprot:2780431-Pleurochrysis_carterae.AAC.1
MFAGFLRGADRASLRRSGRSSLRGASMAVLANACFRALACDPACVRVHVCRRWAGVMLRVRACVSADLGWVSVDVWPSG